MPPLDMPLVLRTEFGRFGTVRGKPMKYSSGTRYQPHEGIDLDSATGNKVHAARGGEVVRINSTLVNGLDAGQIIIDHNPPFMGYVTKYMHVVKHPKLKEGVWLDTGEYFADVSTSTEHPHLHFELWVVVNHEAALARGWPEDADMLPIDPTRLLYCWEQENWQQGFGITEIKSSTSWTVHSVGKTSTHNIPFYEVTVLAGQARKYQKFYVPLLPPVSEDELLLIRMIQDAFIANRPFSFSYVESHFFGVNIITSMRSLS
jgi:hypothetical protein